jgi:hypothetical protein
MIAHRYVQSEGNVSQHATVEAKEEGMGETLRTDTPILRKFDISNRKDDMMMEVQWREEEEPYMTPTQSGKKRNKGKGV